MRLSSIASSSPAIASFTATRFETEGHHVAMPAVGIQLAVRFGAAGGGRDDVDVHALGVREKALRKRIRAGQEVIVAKLRPEAHRAVLGVSAGELRGRIVPLDDLWGTAAAERVREELVVATTPATAAAALERAFARELDRTSGATHGLRLVTRAAERLVTASVAEVADGLGVSERHLRRLFHDTFGLTPKAFARLERFRRALHAATAPDPPSWASIAATFGYYDQAHLIAEFRAVAGATPRVLLRELCAHGGPIPS